MHMATTPVTPDQFDVTTQGITHIPTGATFTPYYDSPNSGTIYKGQMGSVLKSGEEYQPHEVERMMERLWIEFLTENPEVFT
jgi:hypothetical protein